MAKFIRISHMGTIFKWTVNEHNPDDPGPFDQQINGVYSGTLFSDIMNDFSISPISGTPISIGYFANSQFSLVLEDFGQHINQAEKLILEQQSQWINDKVMMLLNNGRFYNPDNGRYFTVTGSLGNPYFNLYTPGDTLIESFQFSEFNTYWLNFYSFTDFNAFATAESWSDAQQYCVHLGIGNTFYGQDQTIIVPYQKKKDVSNASFFKMLWILLGGEDPSQESDDDPYSGDDSPYNPGGEDGGDGDGDNPYDPGDDIDYPDNPDIGLSDSGLLTVYTPTQIQLRLLGNYLWSQNFVDSLVKSVYADPMDVIISLGVVPFNIPAAGTKAIKVGDRTASIGETEVTSNYPSSDFIDIDCGSIHLKTTIGCYLDYAPYTKGHIYIPFVGYVPLDIDYYMTKHIGLKYKVELVTGTAVAFLLADGRVMQQFTCNVKMQVPLSSANAMQMWRSLVESTLAAGALVATGGAAGGATIASGPAAMTAGGAVPAWEITSGEISGSDAANILNGITTKPSFQKSNPHTVSGGYLASKLKPYIILERPNMQLPTDQGKYTGYGAYATKRLGDLKGFTRVSSSRLSIPSATGSELVMIRKALHSGVIIDHIPVIPNGDLVLMRNSSPSNQIGKSLATVATLTGSFRDSANIRQLTIRIEKTDPIGFNYIYSSKFGRFYFIDEITVVRTDILDLHCSIDALESFGSEILANDAIIDKQEKDYNLYLNDNGLKIRQDPLIQTVYFPNGFGGDYEFVLVVAGSN